MQLLPRLFLLILWCLLCGTPCTGQDAPTPPACSLCEAKTTACPTCSGAGVCTVECCFCGGDGKRECLTCEGKQAGWIDCTNRYCKDGKTQWEGGDSDPCKLCAAKGRIQCPDCRGRKATRCVFCAGTGKRARTCWTCAGARRIDCPACAMDPAREGCSTCDGSARATCRLCEKVEAKGTVACSRCDGEGTIGCATCRGLDRTPCTKCAATGKMRLGSRRYPLPNMPAEKAGVKQCDLCEGRAVKNCVDCLRGRLDCKQCERGQVPNVCGPCLHQRSTPCDECLSGGYSRWETLGEFLLAKGHAARAAVFFERALARAQDLRGPQNLPAEHQQMLAALLEFEKARQLLRTLGAALGGDSKAPAPAPAPAFVEHIWPLDLRTRHWAKPPADHPLDPWTDQAWLATHRARVVARLQAALARARTGAAGK